MASDGTESKTNIGIHTDASPDCSLEGINSMGLEDSSNPPQVLPCVSPRSLTILNGDGTDNTITVEIPADEEENPYSAPRKARKPREPSKRRRSARKK
jgi:hypothetical protein